MAKSNGKMIVAFCPACDTRIRFVEGLRMFDTVTCPECDELLEVVQLFPLVLRWVDEEEAEEVDFEIDEDRDDFDD